MSPTPTGPVEWRHPWTPDERKASLLGGPDVVPERDRTVVPNWLLLPWAFVSATVPLGLALTRHWVAALAAVVACVLAGFWVTRRR